MFKFKKRNTKRLEREQQETDWYLSWSRWKNLVESPWKCIVFGQNNNKLRAVEAQSVHTIESWEQEIQDDVKYVGKLVYIGNDYNWLLHDESTRKHHEYWEVYFTLQIISRIVPWRSTPGL